MGGTGGIGSFVLFSFVLGIDPRAFALSYIPSTLCPLSFSDSVLLSFLGLELGILLAQPSSVLGILHPAVIGGLGELKSNTFVELVIKETECILHVFYGLHKSCCALSSGTTCRKRPYFGDLQ